MNYFKVDSKQLKAVAKRAVPFHKKCMVTALEGEAYRLNVHGIKKYAKSWGGGRWKPLSVITPLLRKKTGYGPWVARFSRYYVDPETLRAEIGIIGKRPGVKKFKPISRGFEEGASRHSSGFRFFMSRKRQRFLMGQLLNPNATKRNGKRLYGHKTLRGAQNRYNSLAKAIPKVGWHYVKARPFAAPVLRREGSRSVRNMARIYKMKLAGLRYSSSWAKDWGNA